MELHRVYATRNRCYQRAKPMAPKKIMVHSTGVNNPWLRRYVQPDDGLLGVNPNGNSFNEYKPGGKDVLVHAFIGKKKDGTVATYQVCPWERVAWHSGYGVKGAAYDLGYIGFEICEDGLNDSGYFQAVYREAVELCAYLCGLFQMTEKDIICHSEGHSLGIASNHADVMHWFPRFGKSMNTFRADVKKLLAEDVKTESEDEIDMKEEDVKKLVASEVQKAMTGAAVVEAMSDRDCYTVGQKAERHAKTLPEPEWSRKEGHWTEAAAAGVVDGTRPEGLVTRAEAVAMIGRTMDKVIE